jgi:hypothetical protein
LTSFFIIGGIACIAFCPEAISKPAIVAKRIRIARKYLTIRNLLAIKDTMKELPGVAKGVDKFKGFVGSPEYRARQTGLEQLNKLTQKELANSLTQTQADTSREQGKLYDGELHYDPKESVNHFRHDKQPEELTETEKRRIRELKRRWFL